MGAPRPLRKRNLFIGLVAVVMAAAGIRFAAVEATFPVRPMGDELYYVWTAVSIADGEGHVFGKRRASWPPAQSWLLSRFVDPERVRSEGLVSDALRPLAAAQAGLGTLLVLATMLLARSLFDDRTGLLAGAVAALYPTFVAFSHYYWATTLFALLLTTSLWLCVETERRRSTAWALAAGVGFGAATLARESALAIAAACALWLFLRAESGARRRAAALAAALLVAAAAVVLPWTLRNQNLFGRFVPVSTVGWMAMREGNTLSGDWLRPDEREHLRHSAENYVALASKYREGG